MKILIKITKEILESSKMCEDNRGQNCAIGKAVADLFGVISWVTTNRIEFYEKINTLSFITATPLPDVAKQFIHDFDKKTPEERVKMTPISFEVEVPEKIIDMIGISHAYKVLSESKSLELVNI